MVSFRSSISLALVLTGLLGTASMPARADGSALFMWELRSKTATVYLLGSVHAAPPELYPLPSTIEQAFASADTLVLETPLDDQSMQGMLGSLQSGAIYLPPDSLAKHIPAPLFQRAQAAARTTGLPDAMVGMMHPWLLSMTLSMTQLQKLGFRADQGIDMHFQRSAVAQGKQLDAIETPEEQIALLRDLPQPQQVQLLEQTLDELSEAGPMMQRMFAAWRRGEVAPFEREMVTPMKKEHPALYKRMLRDRNVRMTAYVQRMLKRSGTTFVVVGAAHLVGADGIVALLAKRGLKPTQATQGDPSTAPTPASATPGAPAQGPDPQPMRIGPPRAPTQGSPAPPPVRLR